MIDQVMTINSVQKSSKSELSSRFFGRLKILATCPKSIKITLADSDLSKSLSAFDSMHISEIFGARGFAGMWHKRDRPNASECVRRHLNTSRQVRTGPNTCPNLRKLRKTCENLAKISQASPACRRCFSHCPIKQDIPGGHVLRS